MLHAVPHSGFFRFLRTRCVAIDPYGYSALRGDPITVPVTCLVAWDGNMRGVQDTRGGDRLVPTVHIRGRVLGTQAVTVAVKRSSLHIILFLFTLLFFVP